MRMPMSNTSNTSGSFQPSREAHSIEQIAVAVQFDRPLQDNQLAELRNSLEQFKNDNDLPGYAELQGIAFSLGQPGAIPIPQQLGGMLMHRSAPNGSIERELRIERAVCTYRTTKYTKWDSVWTEAKKYFEVVIPQFGRFAKIAGISLNFQDKYIWNGVLGEAKVDGLLRHDSQYLSPHIFKAEDLWHCHTGAFIRLDSHTKRLLNINVDLLDENSPAGTQKVVSIATVLTDMLNQPTYETLEINETDIVNYLDTRMQSLHAFSKDVFGNIINDEMCKRIALID